MDWYYVEGGQQNGPVDDEAMERLIRNGNVTRATSVWHDGWEDWRSAGSSELAAYFPAAAGAARASARQAQPAGAHGAAAGTAFGPADSSLVYPSNPPKSPWLALLGLLITGLGQIVFGQLGKGLALLGAGILAFGFLGSFELMAIIAVAAVIDAFMVGKALQTGRPVGKWQFFPQG